VLNHLAYKLHFEPEQNRRRREAFLTGSAHLTLIRPNFVNTPLRSAAFIWYKTIHREQCVASRAYFVKLSSLVGI